MTSDVSHSHLNGKLKLSSEESKRAKQNLKSFSIITDKVCGCLQYAEDRYLELKEKRMKLMKELEEHRIDMKERRQEAD